MGDAKFVGVDGCPAGWFSVGLGEGDDDGYEVAVFGTFQELVQHYDSATLILVDIPIGLKESGPEERQCDKKARRLLGQRGSSVFPVPVRQVLNESTYEDAKRVNCRIRGKGISKQTWAIVPKIAEFDRLLADVPSARVRVREVHPEVLFWALNERRAMHFRKKKPTGRAERIAVLSQVEHLTQDVYADASSRWLRKQVARDDILDALAAAVTARLGHPNRLATLPAKPPHDDRGLPMEMVYYNPPDA